MAKMLEEDRILEQQHLEAEQNRKTLMKHELVKRRSTLKQVWFEFLNVYTCTLSADPDVT